MSPLVLVGPGQSPEIFAVETGKHDTAAIAKFEVWAPVFNPRQISQRVKGVIAAVHDEQRARRQGPQVVAAVRIRPEILPERKGPGLLDQYKERQNKGRPSNPRLSRRERLDS